MKGKNMKTEIVKEEDAEICDNSIKLEVTEITEIDDVEETSKPEKIVDVDTIIFDTSVENLGTTSNYFDNSNNTRPISKPESPEKEDPSILVSRLLQEIQQLRQDNRKLATEIDSERQARQQLESAKNSLTAEIEELTKTLFEEANGMVASEAQARWTLQQAHTRLEEELQKTRELLSLEIDQTRLLRGIVEEEKNAKKSSDPYLWDVDLFSARLSDSYYDDFFPERSFDSRFRSSAAHWEALSTQTLDTLQFHSFSTFIDECFRVSIKTRNTQLSDDSIVTVLGHEFIRNCLLADIEPCLAFPVLERSGKTKSMLKKLLPAMLKNNCVIEPLPGQSPASTASTYITAPNLSSLPSPESIRASPLSIRSFISIAAPSRSKTSSPIKSSPAINIPILSRPSDNLLALAGSPTSITSVESCPVSLTVASALLKCSMCDSSGKDSLIPTHRFRICSSTSATSSPVKQPQWNLICKSCRNRLVSVASFFTILRHLLQGLHAHRPKLDVYFDFMHSKRYMFYARTGVDPSFYALSDFEAFSKKISVSGNWSG
jgi:hypothetical protein